VRRHFLQPRKDTANVLVGIDENDDHRQFTSQWIAVAA
jgi:hypothetical protein